jgi:putative dimethyl sulfoxide reductase chaperone
MTDVTVVAGVTDRMGLLAGQALVLNLLGRLLYEFPEPVWLQSLADDGVFEDIPFGAQQPAVADGLALLQQWASATRGGRLALQTLRDDYTSLFVGPGKIIAPPWESAQVDNERQLFQEETLDVRNWYRRFGLESERLYSEPDDHIGLELAFLAHVAQLALAAQAENDRPRVADLLAAERAFLLEHPLRWAPAWCAQVTQHARTGFYRGLALVTNGVLSELAAALAPVMELEVA